MRKIIFQLFYVAFVSLPVSFADQEQLTSQELEETARSLTIKESEAFFKKTRTMTRQEKESLFAILLDSPIPFRESSGGGVYKAVKHNMIDYFVKHFPEIEHVTIRERYRALGPKKHTRDLEKWFNDQFDKDARQIKLWWETNKDKIEYHQDGTHSWKEAPIPLSVLIPESTESQKEQKELPNLEKEEKTTTLEREPKPLPETASPEENKPNSFPWWLLGIVGLIVVLGFMLLKGRSK